MIITTTVAAAAAVTTTHQHQLHPIKEGTRTEFVSDGACGWPE